MSKSLKKLIDINRLREFKNKLVGTGSAYVQTGAVDQTIAGTKTFLKPIPGSVTGSSGSCTGNAATATTATTAKACTGNAATATKLAAKRTIALSGAATGTATGFDGSGNITIPVTSLDASKLTGTASVSTTGNAATATTATTAKACTGNAASANIATKATQDAAGNTITTTYATKADASKTYVTKTDAAKTYATKSEIIVHVGVIIPFAGKSVPTGYLLCNGAAVSRTNYANLFAAIGTLYGAGNGSTTFNLPDARDRVLQGASGKHSAGSYIAAGLPNITGYAQSTQVGIFHPDPGSYSGALFSGSPYSYVAAGIRDNGNLRISIDASRSSSYYGASDTVQPPAIATNFIIKY